MILLTRGHCAVRFGLTGLFFFEHNCGTAETVSGERYRKVLQTFWCNQYNDIRCKQSAS